MTIIEPIVADGGWHMGGWGWTWMALVWVATLSAIWVAIWSASGQRSKTKPRGEDPRLLLARRFASGELSAEQYERDLAMLQNTTEEKETEISTRQGRKEQ